MNLYDLPEDLAQFVQQALARGKYESEGSLVAEAVRVLKQRDAEINGAKVQPGGLEGDPKLQALKQLVRELEALPLESPKDDFSVRDHDKLLYGEP